MIQTMSNNHAFAQRAYSFLQQVLGYMHQSAALRHDQGDNGMTGDVWPVQSTGALPTDMQDDPDTIPNLHALFGLTEDLTNSLELHLGNFDARDLAEGPWLQSFSDQLLNC